MKLSTRIPGPKAINNRMPCNPRRGKKIVHGVQSIVAMLFVALIVSGCGSMVVKQNKQSSSLVDYLYSGQQAPGNIEQARASNLDLPLRIGIAFVPGTADPKFGITEAEQLSWLTRVKAALQRHSFVGEVAVVPTSYLKFGGGFDNLQQVAKLFNVDVVALLSYDQTQFSEPNNFSVMYWTIIGAYMVPGDRYDIHTVLEVAAFDVRNRKLLFRAPGASTVEGSATLAGFATSSRQARSQGFDKALQQLISNVDAELQTFLAKTHDDLPGVPAGDRLNTPRFSERETAVR